MSRLTALEKKYITLGYFLIQFLFLRGIEGLSFGAVTSNLTRQNKITKYEANYCLHSEEKNTVSVLSFHSFIEEKIFFD